MVDPPAAGVPAKEENVLTVEDWPTPALRAPGLETAPPALELPPAEDDLTASSIALYEGVQEATRHSDALAAAETMDSVARRLRQGEILLSPGAPLDSEAAVVASVLQALLGQGRGAVR